MLALERTAFSMPLEKWQAGTGSNRGPADLESAALPTELPTYECSVVAIQTHLVNNAGHFLDKGGLHARAQK